MYSITYKLQLNHDYRRKWCDVNLLALVAQKLLSM